jgi:beta-galactosidase
VPGKLVAKGVRNGKTIETTVETTGAPAAIRLTADRTRLTADNDELAVVTVAVIDPQGRVVPVAGNEIRFKLSGPARLIGVGNGDPSSHEPDQADRRSVFNGLAQAIVQTTASAGKIKLEAVGAGLKPATITMVSQ